MGSLRHLTGDRFFGVIIYTSEAERLAEQAPDFYPGRQRRHNTGCEAGSFATSIRRL